MSMFYPRCIHSPALNVLIVSFLICIFSISIIGCVFTLPICQIGWAGYKNDNKMEWNGNNRQEKDSL